MGLKETEHIASIDVDPRNSDVVYVSALGPVFAPNEHRGLYKSTDGGKTWNKVLFVNDSTGAIDFQFDPSNPDIMYVAFWQAGRTPWSMSSGGGQWAVQEHRCRAHVDQLTKTAKGLPPGIFGKIGIAVSPAKPSRIWALVEHDSGGVYRSDDGGASWQFINGERKLRQRRGTTAHLRRPTRHEHGVRAQRRLLPLARWREDVPADDLRAARRHHDLWIAPNDPKRMINANDGGANVSRSTRAARGATRTSRRRSSITSRRRTSSRTRSAARSRTTRRCAARVASRAAFEIADWFDAGGGESGYVTPHPTKPDIISPEATAG